MGNELLETKSWKFTRSELSVPSLHLDLLLINSDLKKHLIRIGESSGILATEWYSLDEFEKKLILLPSSFQQISILLVFGIEISL